MPGPFSYFDKATGSLAQLNRRGLPAGKTFVPMTIETLDGEEPSLQVADRARVLAAISELTVADGYSGLTIPRIRSAAGVTRRRFDAVFENVEDCYLTAIELRVEDALNEGGASPKPGRKLGRGRLYVSSPPCATGLARTPFSPRPAGWTTVHPEQAPLARNSD